MATFCTVPGCDRRRNSLKYCPKHTACWKRTGDPLPKGPKKCSIEGCQDKHRRNGFCNKHSSRVRRHDNPDAVYPNRMTPEERKASFNKSKKQYEQTPKGKATNVLKRQRRRHLEGAWVTLTTKEVLAIKAKFDFKCFKCKDDSDLCLDHHYPLAKGGKLTVDNCVILCRKCNGSKGDVLPAEWYSERELSEVSELLNKPLILVD